MTYLFLKWIHIVSATIVFGTGIGSAFYLFAANRRGNLAEIRFAIRTVVLADFLFIAPAVAVQFGTGVALMVEQGYAFGEFWVVAALTLFFFVGACWLPVIVIQIRMRTIADAADAAGDALPDRYWKLDRRWIALGTAAFPAMLVIFYLMVFRPGA